HREDGVWTVGDLLPGQDREGAEAAAPGTPGSFLSHRLEARLTRRGEPAEDWAGEVRGPRVQLALGSPTGEITATRMFGYVGGRLMWLWEHRRPVPDGAPGETALTPYLSLEMHRVWSRPRCPSPAARPRGARRRPRRGRPRPLRRTAEPAAASARRHRGGRSRAPRAARGARCGCTRLDDHRHHAGARRYPRRLVLLPGRALSAGAGRAHGLGGGGGRGRAAAGDGPRPPRRSAPVPGDDALRRTRRTHRSLRSAGPRRPHPRRRGAARAGAPRARRRLVRALARGRPRGRGLRPRPGGPGRRGAHDPRRRGPRAAALAP